MPPVTIYATPFCPYCIRAKNLLKAKGVAFDEIDVSYSGDLRRQMIERTGRYTVPQIFIGGRHIGGCDELFALEEAGGLDPLLAE